MDAEPNERNELGALGWLSTALLLSVGLNAFQAVSSRIASHQCLGPGTTTMNQNNANYVFIDLGGVKALADRKQMDETDLSGDIETEAAITE